MAFFLYFSTVLKSSGSGLPRQISSGRVVWTIDFLFGPPWMSPSSKLSVSFDREMQKIFFSSLLSARLLRCLSAICSSSTAPSSSSSAISSTTWLVLSASSSPPLLTALNHHSIHPSCRGESSISTITSTSLDSPPHFFSTMKTLLRPLITRPRVFSTAATDVSKLDSSCSKRRYLPPFSFARAQTLSATAGHATSSPVAKSEAGNGADVYQKESPTKSELVEAQIEKVISPEILKFA